MARTRAPEREVALRDEARVQPHERPVVVRVLVTSGRSVVLAVLVVALVGNEEREVRNPPGLEVVVKTAPPLEADDAVEPDARPGRAFLHALEVRDGVVLHRVQMDDLRGRRAGEREERGRVGVRCCRSTRRCSRRGSRRSARGSPGSSSTICPSRRAGRRSSCRTCSRPPGWRACRRSRSRR